MQGSVNMENVTTLIDELETLPPIASMPALVALAGSLLQSELGPVKVRSSFQLFHQCGYGDTLENSLWWSLKSFENGHESFVGTAKLNLEKVKVSSGTSRSVPQFEGDFYAVTDDNVKKLAEFCRRVVRKWTETGEE